MKGIIKNLHRLFIPSEHNNFRAKALHLNFLAFYLGLALIASIVFPKLSAMGDRVLGVATDISVDRLFTLTNDQRIQNGLPPLHNNDALAAAAAGKAQNMFAHDYWAHYGPDGASPWDFILGAGYHYEYAGENLAKDFNSSQDVVNAWMNSPSHRENIVKPEYQDVGYAIANGVLQGEETTLVVQMFGKPISSTANEVKAQEFTPTLAPAGQSPLGGATPLPTSSALLSPTRIPTQASVISPTHTQGQILINQKQPSSSTGFLNFDSLALKASFLFILFILVAIILDSYHGRHLTIKRNTGKHLAHIIFILSILISLFLLAKGVIL